MAAAGAAYVGVCVAAIIVLKPVCAADYVHIFFRSLFAAWATFSLGTMALAVATFVVRTARAIAPRIPAPPPAPPFTRRTHMCGAR